MYSQFVHLILLLIATFTTYHNHIHACIQVMENSMQLPCLPLHTCAYFSSLLPYTNLYFLPNIHATTTCLMPTIYHLPACHHTPCLVVETGTMPAGAFLADKRCSACHACIYSSHRDLLPIPTCTAAHMKGRTGTGDGWTGHVAWMRTTYLLHPLPATCKPFLFPSYPHLHPHTPTPLPPFYTSPLVILTGNWWRGSSRLLFPTPTCACLPQLLLIYLFVSSYHPIIPSCVYMPTYSLPFSQCEMGGRQVEVWDGDIAFFPIYSNIP